MASLNKFIHNNQYLIDLYVMFLDFFKNNKVSLDNKYVKRLVSDFFIRLMNNYEYNSVEQLFLREFAIRFPSLKLPDFHNKIIVKDIEFLNEKNVISFTFTYNNNKTVRVTKHIDNLSYNKNKDEEIEKYLFLFYFMLGFDFGHFWGVHPKVYTLISKYSDSVVECFASPFNSNLNDYFSILHPIDKHYGSKGEFFKDFLTATYDTYCVNPPFEESIIKDTLELIEKKLLKRPARIFLYLPQWNDIMLPWFEKIKQQPKINIKICRLDPHKSIIYDYIGKKATQAKFGTYFIYIDNMNCEMCEKSDVLCNIMKN